MLHSMTGHGHACLRHDLFTIEVEVKTVNNRFLKITPKISESVSVIETQLDGIVREYVRRGTVALAIRVTQQDEHRAARVCRSTLHSYIEQAQQVADSFGRPWTIELGSMLQLPGVLENAPALESEKLLEQVAAAVRSALADLNQMREREGNAMTLQLKQGVHDIRQLRAAIEQRAPQVLEDYRRRLESKVRSGLFEVGHAAQEIDIVREVLLHSDRCDIREELVRLASHLDQFEDSINARESQGRRLDFLIQELLRETNTIGSKANDAKVAHDVVSIKTLIEQMRELVQNVE